MAKKTRLVGPKELENSTTLQYTVGAGIRTVIRHIHFSNPTGGSVDVTLSIGGADGAGTRVFGAYPIAADSVLDHFCYYVLAAAETIRAHASAATSIVCVVDGDEELV